MKTAFSKFRNLFYFCLGLLSCFLFSYLIYTNQYVGLNTDNIYTDQSLNLDKRTEKYIKSLDISKFERQGTDYFNYQYSPLRLGKSLEKIDITSDYDFKHLFEIENKLKGVSRKKSLQYIYNEVTKNAKNNTEKHIALLKFLQKASLHNLFLLPIYPDDHQMVTDPLVLLELAEMQCGQVARLAVDLFLANGFKARLVQAGRHVLAEVFYENKYHYFDPDMFGNGETVIENGVIPSMIELSQKPYLIDSLSSPYRELYPFKRYLNTLVKNHSIKQENYILPAYPSYFYFHEKSYSNVKALYYQKTANKQQESNKWYGWNYYETLSDKERRIIEEKAQIYYIPQNVTFKKIEIRKKLAGNRDEILLEWTNSKDLDNDLLGYKIYISRKSRGWVYKNWMGKKTIRKFWNKGGDWQYKMYENLFREPEHEIVLTKTKKTKLNVFLPKNNTYYVTVMPYDVHGESVGKKIYPMSNELRIDL